MGPLVGIGQLIWNQATTKRLEWGWFAAWVLAGLAWQFESELRECRKPKESPSILRKKNGFRCVLRPVDGIPDQLRSLVCDFTNEPTNHETERANARDVFAKLSFYNIDVEQNPRFLFDLNGRWASNHEPGKNGKITKEILATDIRVGETVQLDIANSFVGRQDAFAVDNESAWFGFLKPEQKLKGERFLVLVKLTAIGVKENYEFRFENRSGLNPLR